MALHHYRTMQLITVTLLLNLLFLATGPSVARASEPPPLTTVAALDVARYMGRWYEIAKYPNRFQRKCVADTSAEYKLEPDGRVQVTTVVAWTIPTFDPCCLPTQAVETSYSIHPRVCRLCT